MKLDCPDCKQQLPLNHFPFLRNGKRGRYCSACRPPREVSKDHVSETMEFLYRRREETACADCERHRLVYWYRRSDGKLCDVFKMAEDGMKIWFLRRFLSQVKPLCDECAADFKEVPGRKAMQVANMFKSRALKATDKKDRAKAWAMHFRFKALADSAKQRELTSAEEEMVESWEGVEIPELEVFTE